MERFEWDINKNKANILKHNIDFEIVFEADWKSSLILEDKRIDYGETRFLGYVPIRKRLYTIIFTYRFDVKRIISVRKAHRKEVAIYEKYRQI
ncbi:MAG: BrnT family toxin [Rickettsiales bacterium]|nr:BrnT family toxin [Rickettsiales bacterium]